MATNNNNLVIDNVTLSRNAANSLQAQLSKIRNLSVNITQARLDSRAVSDIQAAFQRIRPEIQIGIDVKELPQEIKNAITTTTKNVKSESSGKNSLGQHAAIAATAVQSVARLKKRLLLRLKPAGKTGTRVAPKKEQPKSLFRKISPYDHAWLRGN